MQAACTHASNSCVSQIHCSKNKCCQKRIVPSVSNHRVSNVSDPPGLVAGSTWCQFSSENSQLQCFIRSSMQPFGNPPEHDSVSTWGRKHFVFQLLSALCGQQWIVLCSNELLFRGTPILAGGIGVARFGGWGCFCVWFCCWAIFMSVCFACHATGLDAVQRLEQKKVQMSCCVQKHVSKYLFCKSFKWLVSLYALKMSLLVNEIVPWSCVDTWFGQQDAKNIVQPQVSLAQLHALRAQKNKSKTTCLCNIEARR